MYSSTFVLISLASLQNANYPSLPLKHRVIHISVGEHRDGVHVELLRVSIETVDN